MTHPSPGWDVFLAYAAPDRDVARRLERALADRGLRVCRDETALQPGDRWQAVLPDYVRRSRCVVVLVSRNSPASTYLNDEIAIALAAGDQGGPRVVPVLLEADVPLPYGLLGVQAMPMESEADMVTVVSRLATTLAAESGPEGRPALRHERLAQPKATPQRRRFRSLPAIAACVVVLVAVGVLLWLRRGAGSSTGTTASPEACGGFAMTILSTEGRDDGESVVLRLAARDVGISAGSQGNLQFVYDNGVTKAPLREPTTWGNSFELPEGTSTTRMVVAPVAGWDSVVLRGSDPLGPSITECPVQANR